MSGFCSKKEKFCLMSGLKLALSEVTSFLPDNVSGLKKIIFRRGLIFFSRVTKLFVLPRSMFSYIMVFGLPYLFSQYLFNYLFRDFIKGSFSFILCSSFLCFLLLAFQSRHLTFEFFLCRYTEAATGGVL